MSGPHSTVLPDTTYVTIPAAAGLDADNALPWLIDLDVFEQAVSHVNWDSVFVRTVSLLNSYKGSTGAQNAELNFDTPLAKGTWTVELLHFGGSDSGIYTVYLDSTSVGTIDSYATADNTLSSIAGISVTATDTYRLKLKMESKNASSSAYYGYLQHIQLRRTA